jgi:hypothetical protein
MKLRFLNQKLGKRNSRRAELQIGRCASHFLFVFKIGFLTTETSFRSCDFAVSTGSDYCARLLASQGTSRREISSMNAVRRRRYRFLGLNSRKHRGKQDASGN